MKKEYIKTFKEIKNITWKNRTKILSFEERYSERFFNNRNIKKAIDETFNIPNNEINNKKRKVTDYILFPEEGEIDPQTGKDINNDNIDLSNVVSLSI